MEWHDRYALNPRPFGEEPTPFLREVFDDPSRFGVPDRQLRIFCPGDGYGRNGLWLARRGHSVAALDIVPAVVDSAMATAVDEGVDYVSIAADLSGSPLPLARGSTFDLVVTAWVRLVDPCARRSVNAECTDRLREGGSVVMIGGRRVTDTRSEQSEWPRSLRWQDFSTDDEVRMIGHMEKPAITAPA